VTRISRCHPNGSVRCCFV